jgi:hypothetical protein
MSHYLALAKGPLQAPFCGFYVSSSLHKIIANLPGIQLSNPNGLILFCNQDDAFMDDSYLAASSNNSDTPIEHTFFDL